MSEVTENKIASLHRRDRHCHQPLSDCLGADISQRNPRAGAAAGRGITADDDYAMGGGNPCAGLADISRHIGRRM
jgi:hypothetical protein